MVSTLLCCLKVYILELHVVACARPKFHRKLLMKSGKVDNIRAYVWRSSFRSKSPVRLLMRSAASTRYKASPHPLLLLYIINSLSEVFETIDFSTNGNKNHNRATHGSALSPALKLVKNHWFPKSPNTLAMSLTKPYGRDIC